MIVFRANGAYLQSGDNCPTIPRCFVGATSERTSWGLSQPGPRPTSRSCKQLQRTENSHHREASGGC